MTITQDQIDRLFNRLGALGDVCIRHLDLASRGFLQWDRSAVVQVESEEDAFADATEEVEEETLRVIALHQPVASDLKRIIYTFKLTQEMDRLHTYIHRIARKTVKLCEGEQVGQHEAFRAQFVVVQTMLRSVVDHFRDPSSQLVAEELEEQQQECNRLKKDIKREIDQSIAAEIQHTSQFLVMQGISRRLDNMAKLLLDMWAELGDYCQLRR